MPLKTDFRPTVKVLSRKPVLASRADPAARMAGLALDDEDDSEEEERKRKEADFVERQRRAHLEREEKQRKYAEVRERLFGSPANPPSRDSSSASQHRSSPNGDSRSSSRRGRGRGGRESHNASAAPSPARIATQGKQLFDPSFDPKPKTQSPRPTMPKEHMPVRSPRGPDNSGRGGFGFGPRGGRADAS